MKTTEISQKQLISNCMPYSVCNAYVTIYTITPTGYWIVALTPIVQDSIEDSNWSSNQSTTFLRDMALVKTEHALKTAKMRRRQQLVVCFPALYPMLGVILTSLVHPSVNVLAKCHRCFDWLLSSHSVCNCWLNEINKTTSSDFFIFFFLIFFFKKKGNIEGTNSFKISADVCFVLFVYGLIFQF